MRAVPILIVLFIWTMTTHGKYSDSGDEPHYLMVAESLRADGDLDVENNYRTTVGGPEPGPHVRRTRAGSLWSVHDIGVPIVLLPVYSIATWVAARTPENVLARFNQTPGLFAYSIVSLALTVLTAWAIALLLSGFRRVARNGPSVAVALVLGLSPPVVSHAFLVFPETLAFAVVCAVVWIVCLRDDEMTVTKIAAVVLAVAVLPWLHRKYSFFEFGLFFLLIQRHWSWIIKQRGSVLVALAGLALAPQLALHAWTTWAWGGLGGPQMADGLPFSLAGVHSGSLGLLVDRERGLFGYAPIYAIAPACLALTWRENRRLLVPIVLLFLPMASFVVWSAGFSPAARYLVPLMPLVALPAVRALDRPAVRWAAAPLLVFQAAIVAYAWGHPRALWPKDLGGNELLDHIPIVGPAYAAWLPSIATGDPIERGWLCLLVISAMTIAIVFVRRNP